MIYIDCFISSLLIDKYLKNFIILVKVPDIFFSSLFVKKLLSSSYFFRILSIKLVIIFIILNLNSKICLFFIGTLYS